MVTGASGFLGASVVRSFLDAGHEVTALVRPAAQVDRLDWPERVRIVRADLRTSRDLGAAFEGVDVLVHLAACVVGDEEAQFASTVVGTERILAAMARTDTRRLVLASSFSVYDWDAVGRVLTESSPVEADLYARDGYAIAKVWQERLAVEAAAEHAWDLVVLRPGYIWGSGHTDVPCTGQAAGPFYLAFGPWRRLALTHVDNCASAFVLAAADSRATGQTFNVVDPDPVTVWRFLGDSLGAAPRKCLRVPVPYWLAISLVRMFHWAGRRLFGSKVKFPSLFVPLRFQARFKPVCVSPDKLREVLGWHPPMDYGQALARSIDRPATSESATTGAPALLRGQ